eukprot:m.317280 g.317280  ORF g.317280 m.317280 type:complete len:1386 (+) comp16433_c1_seq3:101-4258(+)
MGPMRARRGRNELQKPRAEFGVLGLAMLGLVLSALPSPSAATPTPSALGQNAGIMCVGVWTVVLSRTGVEATNHDLEDPPAAQSPWDGSPDGSSAGTDINDDPPEVNTTSSSTSTSSSSTTTTSSSTAEATTTTTSSTAEAVTTTTTTPEALTTTTTTSSSTAEALTTTTTTSSSTAEAVTTTTTTTTNGGNSKSNSGQPTAAPALSPTFGATSASPTPSPVVFAPTDNPTASPYRASSSPTAAPTMGPIAWSPTLSPSAASAAATPTALPSLPTASTTRVPGTTAPPSDSRILPTDNTGPTASTVPVPPTPIMDIGDMGMGMGPASVAPSPAPTAPPTSPPTPPLALLPNVSFYPGGLPDEVLADELPIFSSAVSPQTRAASIRELFAWYSAPRNLEFSYRILHSDTANGTTVDDSFFYMRSGTAEILVSHPVQTIGSNFTIEIFAEDTGGPGVPSQTVSIVNWTYTVVGEATLDLSGQPFEMQLNGVGMNATELPDLLSVGGSYRFQAPASGAADIAGINAMYFTGVQGSVTYGLVQTTNQAVPDGDVVVNTETGSVFLAPSAVYNVTFALFAQDESGRGAVTILTWSFETRVADVDVAANGPNGRGCDHGVPLDLVPFDHAFGCDCTGSGFNGSNCEIREPNPQLYIDVLGQYVPPSAPPAVVFYNRTQWATGVTYFVAPVRVANARTERVGTGNLSVRFSLDWGDEEDPPSKFFIDGATGEMLVSVPNEVRDLTAWLLAESAGTEPAVVATITFNTRPADTTNASYGPGGADCADPSQRVDGDEFDESYTCDCGTSKFTGPNCDQSAVGAGSSSGGSKGVEGQMVAGIAVLVLVILVAVLLIRNRWLEQWKARQPHKFDALMATLHEHGLSSARNAEGTMVPAELHRSDLVLLEVLGAGNFGEVTRGRLTTTAGHGVKVTLDVAVKTLLHVDAPDARDEFLREAAVTWHFKHPNVVQMHGVVTAGEPYLLVLELCEQGELKSYLESDANDGGIRRTVGFLADIAAGMAHLAALGFVHRDLAARNVLLDRNFGAKVADFGLGRDTAGTKYYSAGQASKLVLPLRWSDPEVLETSKFSELTDVWSYGITCIEIFTDGAKPYAGWSNGLVVDMVKNGFRLPRPPACPKPVYDAAILPCWHPLRSDPPRPTFAMLVARLDALRPEIEAQVAAEAQRGRHGGGVRGSAGLPSYMLPVPGKDNEHLYYGCPPLNPSVGAGSAPSRRQPLGDESSTDVVLNELALGVQPRPTPKTLSPPGTDDGFYSLRRSSMHAHTAALQQESEGQPGGARGPASLSDHDDFYSLDGGSIPRQRGVHLNAAQPGAPRPERPQEDRAESLSPNVVQSREPGANRGLLSPDDGFYSLNVVRGTTKSPLLQEVTRVSPLL